MKAFLKNLWKKTTAVMVALVITTTALPQNIPFTHAENLDLSFNTSGSSNFPSGTGIPFSINTTPTATTGNNVLNDPLFPAGSFTLTATLPSNTQIGSGSGYSVASNNSINFTVNSGASLNLVINVVNTPTPPPAPTTGTLNLSFTTPGSFPGGTGIPFSINTTPTATTGNNVLNDPLFPVGTFMVTATLPAGFQVIAGSDYTVASASSATFTTTTGTLNLNIQIGAVSGGGGGGGGGSTTSTLNLSFTTPGTFPSGTAIPFSINTTPTATTGNNTLNDPLFPVGTFTVSATLPAGFRIIAGTDYVVATTTSATFTTTAGGTLNLNIQIGVISGGGGGGGGSTGTLNLSFTTPGTFPAATAIPFSINTTPTATTGNNSLNDPLFPAGTFILTATLPAGFQIIAGTGYTVVSTSSASFTLNAGATLNLNIQIGVLGGGGGGGGTGTLNLSFTRPATFPPATAIPFSINTTPTATTGNDTLNDPLFPAGTFTLTATLPAGFRIIAGANYAVATLTSATFTMTAGATLNLNVQIGAIGGGGGGGNGLAPSIMFLLNQTTITALTLQVGQSVSITVIATDPQALPVTLTLATNPTTGRPDLATFTVVNQGTSTVTGTLAWTVGATSLGLNNFIFSASNGQVTNTTLPITVDPATTGGGGGPARGGSGGGGGGPTFIPATADKFDKCRYKDNETESVMFLCMLGVIDPPTTAPDYSGKSKDNKFFGMNTATRADFTKVMVNITYEKSDIEKIAELIIKNNFFAFPDVEPIAWFAKFIAIAKLDDEVHGYPHNGLFIPWNMIEISEACKILLNTAAHDNTKIRKDLEKSTSDIGKEPWFARFALLVYSYGGYTPKLDRDLGLIYSKQLTRQQAADMIYTTILNAGIEPRGRLSALKQELTTLRAELN